MRLLSGVIALIGVAVLFSSCQTMPYQPYARNVKTLPKKGGVVALNLNHRDEDRVKAETIMKRTCANKDVEITEEGEVVTGTVTNSRDSYNKGSKGTKVGSLFGIPVTSGSSDPSRSSSSETTQKKEWQIKYKCLKTARKKSKKKTL